MMQKDAEPIVFFKGPLTGKSHSALKRKGGKNDAC